MKFLIFILLSLIPILSNGYEYITCPITLSFNKDFIRDIIENDILYGWIPSDISIPEFCDISIPVINKRTINQNSELYLSNDAILSQMNTLCNMYQSQTNCTILGRTTQSTIIPLFVLGTGPVAIKLIANIHGDEVIGREILIKYISYLLETHSILLDFYTMYIIPTLNPDGFALKQRWNAEDVDINRDFPDIYFPGKVSQTNEALAIQQLSETIDFKFSIAFHGGAKVVNYPYDGNAIFQNGLYTPTVDDDIFKNIASVYAEYLGMSYQFPSGITNGAEWYVLYGGMQDWNYNVHNTFEITVELDQEKWPLYETIPIHWEKNKQALDMTLLYVKNNIFNLE